MIMNNILHCQRNENCHQTLKRKSITQDMVNEVKIKVMEKQLKIIKKEHDKKMEILEIKLEIKKQKENSCRNDL